MLPLTRSMKQPEGLKLTGGVKISKTAPVIPSLPALSPSNVLRDLNKAANILKNGGVVIFPTDTVYGIGCRLDDQKAIGRIYQIKGTPQNQPFPILVSDIKQVARLAKISKVAKKLINKFWPGGLTIILQAKSGQKIGFRQPKSGFVESLIDKVGVPIIGTSANLHGKDAVESSRDLDPELIKQVDYVLKGECEKGIESTVVDVTTTPPKILRQGAIKIDDLPAGRQVIKIDTTKREEVTVELTDPHSGKSDKLVEKQKMGSQVLLPMIVKILKKNKIKFSDLTAIEVNLGPGSFTGTRVGISVANALGYALNLPVNGKKGKIAIPVYEKSKFD